MIVSSAATALTCAAPQRAPLHLYIINDCSDLPRVGKSTAPTSNSTTSVPRGTVAFVNGMILIDVADESLCTFTVSLRRH